MENKEPAPVEDKIAEGNKAIAEFMGGVKWVDKLGCYWFEIPPTPNASNGWTELQYHTSWDWLMPACKKFNETRKEMVTSQFRQWNKLNGLISHSVLDFDIIGTFTNLGKAINWYNQNKNK